MIKGYSTPRKGDEKVDESEVKEETRIATEEFEKMNAKGEGEMSDKSKGPLRKLQTN